MLAERVIELLRELTSSNNIPPYNNETIREVIAEINNADQDIRETLSSNKDTHGSLYISSNIIATHGSISRNKQCLLAYLMHRLHKIKELRWELDADIPDEILNNLSPKEGEFLIAYDNMLNAYMQAIELDLTKVRKDSNPLYSLGIIM